MPQYLSRPRHSVGSIVGLGSTTILSPITIHYRCTVRLHIFSDQDLPNSLPKNNNDFRYFIADNATI